MIILSRRFVAAIAAISLTAAANSTAYAQKKYDPGASDTEIRVGNIMPYSGPASAYAVIGKAEAAYFNKINAEGGINGRKINFVSYDDGYSPPKAVEQARKLIESDETLIVFSPLGTPSNSAIQKYLNVKNVPHLFAASGATRWNDPKEYPWTMGWQPNYQSEGRIYAKYLMKEKPYAKIGVLYQNDDFGKDLLKGLKDGLGASASTMIIAEEPYEVSMPTVDSQVVTLKSKGVDTFISLTTPKFAAQSIKKVSELGWKPLFILNSVASSVGAVIKPVGFNNAQGLISATYLKDPSDPQWQGDAGLKSFDSFLTNYLPEANRDDVFVLYGYSIAQTLVHVLKACGDDLTRENVMRQAARIKAVPLDMTLPGILLNTSAKDFAPIEQLQMMRFDGERWKLFGEIINGEM